MEVEVLLYPDKRKEEKTDEMDGKIRSLGISH